MDRDTENKWTPEKHKARHELLHRHLDELAADFFAHTQQLLSQTDVLDLMKWSYEQTKNPTEFEDIPAIAELLHIEGKRE